MIREDPCMLQSRGHNGLGRRGEEGSEGGGRREVLTPKKTMRKGKNTYLCKYKVVKQNSVLPSEICSTFTSQLQNFIPSTEDTWETNQHNQTPSICFPSLSLCVVLFFFFSLQSSLTLTARHKTHAQSIKMTNSPTPLLSSSLFLPCSLVVSQSEAAACVSLGCLCSVATPTLCHVTVITSSHTPLSERPRPSFRENGGRTCFSRL